MRNLVMNALIVACQMCLSYVGSACWVSLRGGIDTSQGHQMLVPGLSDIGKRCEVDAS